LRREVSAPGLAGRAGGLCQARTIFVGAVEAAEIGALARPDTGDEECHVVRLLRDGRHCRDDSQRTQHKTDSNSHCALLEAHQSSSVALTKTTAPPPPQT